MLNTNNTVNYEINVKRKEKKYSWSIVFAWLYLKTIGRILPKKWNKWAENILSNKVTFQDTIMQTECVETTGRNIGADLKPEVAEKGSQSEIMSEDEGIYSEVSSGSTDESFDAKLNDEFIDEDYNDMEEVCTEDDKELNAQLEGVNQELELERLQNAFLKKENEDLESKLAECKKDYEDLQAESEEKSQLIFERIDMKINSLMRLNEGLDEDLQGKNQKPAEQEKLIEQLKTEQKQVEDQLKADIKKLQGEKENMEEQLKIMQQQLLNNQEQQKLEEKLKDVDKRLEDIDGETQKSQGQTKTKASDTVSLVSTVSTAKSTTGSMKSTQSNGSKVFSKLFGDKNLNNFLSRKNEELKKGFPEFKEKHFCHNVLNETIKSLLNQDDGKFESSKLLELLESNLKQSAREIIEAKVKEVVNEHCHIGKNVGKEL
ncbi:hypothetical protein [Wolbachia endosymbiont (group A) of Andrena hattorfiana]|uniref:hypothetical protein n=1 Tax=Wolbachia endosymbiont (group A) of Andrena hattorfiana TaxID=2953977 RepID=UPI0021F86621|nr:hypothetical protein [Wolbachia endosymbiont (group A) of Andrena hattorfiana]